MKIFHIFFLALCSVISLGLLFFILRFDPVPLELKIENYLQQSFAAKATVKNLTLHYKFPIGIKIGKIELKDPQTNLLFFQGKNINLGIKLGSLFALRPVFDSLAIQKAEMYLNRLDPNENLWLFPGPLSHPEDQVADQGRTHDLAVLPLKLSAISIAHMNLYLVNEWDKRGQETVLRQMRLTAARLTGELDYAIEGSFFDSSKDAHQYKFKARYRPGNRFLNLHLSEINQHVMFKGVLDLSHHDVQWRGVLNIMDVPVESFLSWLSDVPITDLRGKVSIQTEGNFQGTHPKALFAQSQIRGTLDIADGVDFKQNVVQQVFREMAADFPPFQEFFYGDLPPEVNQLLHGDETPFQNIHASFRLRDGKWSTDDLRLKHYAYLIKLAGSYNFSDNKVHFEGRLVLLEKFTEYAVSKIYQLGILRNDLGRLPIPVVLEGVWPDFVIHPDMDYLFKQLEESAGADYRKKIQKQIQIYGEKK